MRIWLAGAVLLTTVVACGDGRRSVPSSMAAGDGDGDAVDPAHDDAGAGTGPGEELRRPGAGLDAGPMGAAAGDGGATGAARDAGPPEPGCPPPDSVVQFDNRAAAAGLAHLQAPPNADAFYDAIDGVPLGVGEGQAMLMSGGAAAGDYDRDGWVDLYFTRMGGPGRLYRNLGDGTFEDTTAATGLTGATTRGNGAGWVDIDNDDDPDLLITPAGGLALQLWVNDGAGHFTEQAASRGVATGRVRWIYGQGVSFADFDRDGFLDMHTNEWTPKLAGEPTAGRLFRNLGADNPGHFEDVTDAAGVETTRGSEDYSFTSVFSDLDGDGLPDLAVSGDFGTSRLFWNRGDGTFEDGTQAAGVGTDENGMGGAVGDYDGDGLLDWFVTSIYWPSEISSGFGTSGNRLYRNVGTRRFEDATDAAGVRLGYWGWGATFFDADNDGDLDLAMTNGVDLRYAGLDQFLSDPARLWLQHGGCMAEVSGAAGADDRGDGKALLSVDYDRDGDLDLVIANHAAAPLLLNNQGPAPGHWLQLALRGRTANSHGVGARARVYLRDGEAPLVRELRSGGGYLSQEQAVMHFGLGRATVLPRVEVDWPTPGQGKVQVLTDVAVDQRLVLDEPD